MDTRSKILTCSEAMAVTARPAAVVTGTFDVLRAAHVRELEMARRDSGAAALLVVVLPCYGELLAQRARAELVAALRGVDYVVACSADEVATLAHGLGAAVIRLEAVDARLATEIRQLVWERQAGERLPHNPTSAT